MPLVQLDFWPAYDVNGTSIGSMSSDDDFFEGLSISPRLRSLGGGTIVTSRSLGFAAIDSGIIAPEAFVRVLIPSVHATKYLWGFFINLREQTLVSLNEKGGEGFVIGGLGPMQYLRRAILWDEQFHGTGNHRIDRDNGVFRYDEDHTIGDILIRLKLEDDNNTIAQFLPDLTWGFDADEDSAGSTWTSNYKYGEAFELPIGDDYLEHFYSLQEGLQDSHPVEYTMDLGEVGSPLLQIDAWKDYGRDLTGSTLGAGVVLVREAVNLESELKAGGGLRSRGRQESGTSVRKASHSLVIGSDAVYGRAVRSAYVPGGYAKAAAIDYPDSGVESVLDRAGLRWLRHQEDGDNEFQLTIAPGFDETAGRYMAGPDGTDGHVWLGDTITLKTGDDPSSSWLDYHFDDQRVMGIDLALRDAAKDDTDTNAALSWDLTLLLNVDRGSDNQADSTGGGGGTGPHKHKPNPALCRPGVFEVLESLGELGAACSAAGTNVASDYPPWSGDNEERVEITSAIDVPVGATIIVTASGVGIGLNLDHTVYDEQGNDWVDDADSPLQGTADRRAQVWRCNVDTAIAAGDYIRLAFNVGTGTGSAEAGGRCLSAHAFSTTLTVAEVGSGNNGFSSTASLGSTGDGDVAVVACAAYDDTPGITPDADWALIDGYEKVDGSGALQQGLLGQYLMPGTGDAWTMGIDQSRDWTAISVGYSSDAAVTLNDGHPDLVGTSKRAARCDHRHDVHRSTAPTVNDDWETAGYKLGTIWAQLDDLESPTEIVAVWMLLDDATGAAVWGEWPSGGGGIAIEEEGSSEGTGIDTLNFTGAGVDVSVTGTEATIDITSGGGSAVVPWAIAPDGGAANITNRTIGAANRAVIVPCTVPAACTLTGVRLSVGTSSGNISVGLYDSSLARVATSGAVACPTGGAVANVAFTGNYSAAAGRYYIGLSADNNTATFGWNQAVTSGLGSPVHGLFMATAHPLPNPFVSAGEISPPAIIARVSGGSP